jgi:hypothetical protein
MRHNAKSIIRSRLRGSTATFPKPCDCATFIVAISHRAQVDVKPVCLDWLGETLQQVIDFQELLLV